MTHSWARAAAWSALSLLLASAVGGCSLATRLSEVGDTPALSEIPEDTTEEPAYRPVHLPMPARPQAEENPNSLWRPGARAFFKDTRAKEVGDILTIRLKLDDSAKLKNSTKRARDDGETQSIDAMLGFEGALQKVIPAVGVGGPLLSFGTDHQTQGNGGIDRQEEIDLTFAAIVTQVLPNGLLAIVGRQEIRVNYELRELMITGVIRPQDIEADNSISHEKIAEMRVAYGGRGTLSDLQQPRWGTQIWDIIFPF
jgi:flagellar L-ring protein precursor FlgH